MAKPLSGTIPVRSRPRTSDAINTWVAGHPVAHAWCVDPEGFVVDTTWDEGMDYLGVPFRTEYVRRMAGARRRDYPLIDSEEMGFPLLTGAHAVAEAVGD